jgi:hypothetical protein
MKLKILLKETGVYRPSVPQGPKESDLQKVQDYYKLKVIAPISVGLTAFSDVYLVEPADVSNYPQKELVLKLSTDPNEYRAYLAIKNKKSKMIASNNPEDAKASLYLPNIYTAELLVSEVPNPSVYESIIIMEKLVPFTGILKQKQLTTTLTGNPVRSTKTLLYMFRDEAFIDRAIKYLFKVMEQGPDIELGYRTLSPSDFLINKIVGDIVSGKEIAIDTKNQNINIATNSLRSLIRKKVAPGLMAKVDNPAPASYYVNKEKRTPEQQKEVEIYLASSDKNDRIFLEEMKQVQKEMYRIGDIFIYYADRYGDLNNVELMFDTFLEVLKKSTPVAPVSAVNPYPQNPETRPEEVVPGAESFAKALQTLEDYGIERSDLHGKNYMMRENGQIVISDPGLFRFVKNTRKGI